MPDILVVDKVVSPQYVVKKIAINQVSVIPYTSASISVAVYYDESVATILSPEERIKYVNIFMPTTDYLLWQNDDTYLVNFVLGKLGLTAQ